MFYISSQWTGGIYATPTIAGSRPGGLVATCWTSMMALGDSGYEKVTKQIVKEFNIILKG
jgi:sphinganine-1-phosphate aldolase